MPRLVPSHLFLAAMVLLSSAVGAQAIVYTVTNHQAVGATLDLNPANVYTHKLDFPGDGNSTAINGVSFTTAPAGTFPSYSLTMANPSNFSSGSSNAIIDFIHNGSQPAGAVETLTLNGLTPGQSYDLRLYYRNFGVRPNNVVINTGSAPVFTVLDQATASDENYHSIKYKAEATSITLTLAQQQFNASWHNYALTNEDITGKAPQVALIGGLFPTGVGANGAPLANGAADIHFNFAGGPQASLNGALATVQANNGAWAANDGQSKWIGVTASGGDNVASGIYQYTINFEIPAGADPKTATIGGNWLADNDGTGTRILLNGIDTLVSNIAPFNAPLPGTAFTIVNGQGGSAFVSGVNTLTFFVNNPGGANPHGLRVTNLFGSVVFVPEPSSVVMLLMAGVATLRRGKRRN